MNGIPEDLAKVLEDPGIVVPRDALVFDLIARWAKAPTPTLSAPASTVPETVVLAHITGQQQQPARATTGVGC